jgi:DNA (cytosine-5)-methyltransferase 1
MVQRSERRKTLPRAVSLFSGAGGLDLGLEAGGWHVLAQVEMHPDCVETLRLQAVRKVDPPVIVPERIEDARPLSLLRRLKLKKGDLDLLAGGPPCQPFTTSGLRQGLNDPRLSSLFPAYFKFVSTYLPKTLLIENVDGMLSAALRHRPLASRGKEHPPLVADEQKGSFLKWFLGRLVKLGYSVTWGVTEAADYGVPQMRQRAILIGVRGDEPCYLPPPLNGRPGLTPYRTLRDALSTVTELGPVQPLSVRKREVYARVPVGGNWRDLPDELRRATMGAAYAAQGGKSGWWRRLSWDLPAPTILGMPDHSSTALIHPDEVRCLSVNECAAIQTFHGVRFAGSARSQYQQIGNAVPVLMGQRLGEHIRRFLAGERTDPPTPPPWRQESANRRIGTHGWVTPTKGGARYCLNVTVRDDHIWKQVQHPSLFPELEEAEELAEATVG